MKRSEVLQEVRRMRFEEVYNQFRSKLRGGGGVAGVLGEHIFPDAAAV